MSIENPNNSPLLIESHVYKPFKYPFGYEAWLLQNQLHWLPTEVPLAEDVRDWNRTLTPGEKNLLTQIFRFFTQNDVEVAGSYDLYASVFGPNELKMMFKGFANIECVHQAAYAHLLDTVGMPEIEYSAFLKYKEMKDKFDYMQSFGVGSRRELAVTMACFAAFTEGLQLFASFAMLMNFPRFNKMKGMGQIVTWSVRDETLLVTHFKRQIYDVCRTIVEHEDAFIDLAFEMGDVEGLKKEDVKQYIRFIADRRLIQLGLKGNYNVRKNPLEWMDEVLNAPELANFFEQRATEYSRSAMTGSWEEAFEDDDDHYTVYGQTGCPQCLVAKSFLTKKGYDFEYVDLTNEQERKVVLYEETNARSMPIIFKNGKFLGSVFDLEKE